MVDPALSHQETTAVPDEETRKHNQADVTAENDNI
jgi:hypothetical protein